MDKHEKLVMDTLKAHGAEVVRQRKHIVWRFPDGRSFVQPSTIGDDIRGWKNQWTDLRKMLDLADEERGQAGERREKRPKRVRKPVERLAVLSGLKVATASVYASLMAVVRRPKPRHECCFPMERRVVLQTPVSVILAHLFTASEREAQQ